MTALPVAYYLKELNGEGAGRIRGVPAFATEGHSDIELQLSEARARGALEGRAAAQVEQDAALAAQAAAFEQKLAAERQKWAAEQGAHLGSLIKTALADVEQRVSDLVGEVLKPILSEQIRARILEHLMQSLDDMLSKGDYAKITISGPADVIAAMQERLTGHTGLSFVTAQGADITVNADDTILATRIGAWAAAIEGRDP